MFITLIAGLVINQEAQIKSTEEPKVKVKRSVTSRHPTPFRVAQATCYNTSENGSVTASGTKFVNGPEYYCALPTNLNPRAKYCRHFKGQCNSILVKAKSGIIEVHVVDHCPKFGVIDFNQSAANKIFLNKDSSSKIWWSRSSVLWKWK